MRIAVLGLLLMGCGPVMLGEDSLAHDAGTRSSAVKETDADPPSSTRSEDDKRTDDDGKVPAVPTGGGKAPRPSVSVSVKPLDCGRCFALRAAGAGGQPPYRYEWEDGSTKADREVCIEDDELWVSVVATDTESSKTDAHLIRLESVAPAQCPATGQPPSAATPPALCLENPSFEGMPVPNFGQSDAFDAEPWSACVDAATSGGAPNTPNIINETVPTTAITLPKAMDGSTYLALSEAEQVSQLLCKSINAGDRVSFELDLSRLDAGEGLVPQTEKVFLEIYAGVAVDCSRRELLWASPALEFGWKRFCVTLHPSGFLNQITLRANADMSQPSPAYLAVDNVRPVSSCP